MKYELENTAQEFNQKSITNMISEDCNHVKVYSEDSEWESKERSIDTFPLSDWELRSSPYEARIFDWITELQNGFGEKEREHDCDNSQEFAESCYNIWDYSGYLWNMN